MKTEINPKLSFAILSSVYSRLQKKDLASQDWITFRLIYEMMMQYMTTEGISTVMQVILETYMEASNQDDL